MPLISSVKTSTKSTPIKRHDLREFLRSTSPTIVLPRVYRNDFHPSGHRARRDDVQFRNATKSP